jgi:hypothetical protein
MGITGSKSEWMSKYINESVENNNDFPSLLPIAMNIAKTTIGQDLGFASEEEINSVKKRIISENRDGKIESIINDEEFKEKTLEEDEEYKELMKRGVVPMTAPSGHLFYLDFKYESTSN